MFNAQCALSKGLFCDENQFFTCLRCQTNAALPSPQHPQFYVETKSTTERLFNIDTPYRRVWRSNATLIAVPDATLGSVWLRELRKVIKPDKLHVHSVSQARHVDADSGVDVVQLKESDKVSGRNKKFFLKKK